MIKICEHNQHEHDKDRCRRHARFVVLRRVPFGKRVDMNGPDRTVYRTCVAFRCPDHVEDVTHELQRMTMDEYTLLARGDNNANA